MKRTFELLLGVATLLPMPIFVAFVIVLIAGTPAEGEFPIVPVLLMVLWTAVNFLPAIILAVDAYQHDAAGWAVLIVMFGGFVTPVYYWTRRWPRVSS